MQIACPACKTKISVPDDKIKPEGTKVKCGKCSKIFTVKKKSAEAKEKAAPPPKAADDDLFGPPPQSEPPPPAAPTPEIDPAAELGLGMSSAPAVVDDDYLGGDNFGAEMDNYKTQVRPVAGRDSSLFGSSEDLDHGRKAEPPRAERPSGLFGEPDGGEAAPRPRAAAAKAAPAPKPAATPDLDDLFGESSPPAAKAAPVKPPKADLDDLFGKGLDGPADDMVEKLLDAKPAKTSKREDLDDLFGPSDAPVAAPAREVDSFFDEEPAPAKPAPKREAPPPPPAPKGPTAEELAATMKLEPALKEEDAPKAPPPPKPADAKAAPAKKRSLPVKQIALGLVGLAVAGGVAAAIFVPAVNQPVMGVLRALPLDKVTAIFNSEPQAARPDPIDLSVTVTGGRLLEGGRGDKLYVVEGRVRNDYAGSRSFIKVRGTLVGADGAVLSTRDVFAGNILNDEEIRGLDRVKIDGILNRSVGGGLVNFNVPSGKDIPFQIVFYDVEQPVASQQVEPVGSEPGS